MTRSLVEAWRGHALLSFRYHPFGIPLFLICLLVIMDAILDRRSAGADTPVRCLLARLSSRRVLSPITGLSDYFHCIGMFK